MSANAEANFIRAHAQLKDFLEAVAEPNLRRTAVIQAFGYTFEAGWKLLRARVLDAGEVPTGPRDSIQKACKLGILEAEDEDVWLDMLLDRNNSVQTYNEDLAVAMESRIRSKYQPAFDGLASPSGGT